MSGMGIEVNFLVIASQWKHIAKFDWTEVVRQQITAEM